MLNREEDSTADTGSLTAGAALTRPGAFVGRHDVLRILHTALTDGMGGRGRVVLLSGEPGIGKTRVCEELAVYARECGARVLWGRCYEGAGAPAFWPWVQVLRASANELDADRVREFLTGAPELAQLIGAVGAVPVLPEAPLSESPETRFRFFDGVTRVLRALAEPAPLLIVFDDLHAADRSSLLLLEFVTRALRDLPVLIVGTHRDVDARGERTLTEMLVELAREPSTERLVLRGLSELEVGELVKARAGVDPPPALLSPLYQRTEGNPLFVGECVRVLLSQYDQSTLRDSQCAVALTVPHTVQAVIAQRLAPLSAACRAILRVAAVLGRDFAPQLLTAAVVAINAGADDATAQEVATARALEEADEAGIVGPQPDAPRRYRFAHALIQETLYEGLPVAERVQLHRHVGEAMEQLSDADEHLAELAHHFSQAGTAHHRKAIHYARRAGERAMAMLAYEEAVRSYQLALHQLQETRSGDEAERCAILVDLGIAQREACELEMSKATLRRGAELAQRLGLRQELARAALHFGPKSEWGDQPAPHHERVQLLETAIGVWGEKDSAWHARLLAHLALALRLSDDAERRMYLSRRALEMARRLDDSVVIAEALNAWLKAHRRPDNPDECLDLATELAHRAEQIHDIALAARGHHWRRKMLFERGDWPAVEAACSRREQLLLSLRDPFHRAWHHHAQAGMAIHEGRFAEAERLMQEGLALEQTVDSGPPFNFIVFTFSLWLIQGRRDILEAVAARQGADGGGFAPRVAWQCARAYIARELGNASEARAEFEPLAAHKFADFPQDEVWFVSMHWAAEVCAFLGDAARAEDLIELLMPYVSRPVLASGEIFFGAVSYDLGLLETTLHRWDDAVRHFESALEMTRGMRARPALARTQCEYARMLLARAGVGDADRALALLDEALAGARELAMPLLVERVHALRDGQHRGAEESTISEVQSARRIPQSATAAVFRREGDYWMLSYEHSVARLKDTKGLQYVAHLLHHPDREFLALDLVTEIGEQGLAVVNDKQTAANTGLVTLDAQAKAEYRRRLADLRADIEEAEGFNDLGRADKAREEIEFIAHELSAAVGLHGKDRSAGATAERARLMVTKRIKDALKRIDEIHPPLGHHLRACVKTGYYCAYTPSRDQPVAWQF